MQFTRFTSRDAVLQAIAEHDAVGREDFLRRYGFRRATRYELVHGGRRYDSKAIFGVAWGHQFPSDGPRAGRDFVGGLSTQVPVLRGLGFEVIDITEGAASPELIELHPGRVYSWEELGAAFDFKPNYLSVAGGMLPRPELNALLLVTHPGGARSFNYGDYWDGDDLVYTGRGKLGPQQLDGANADVSDNRKALYVFEQAGSRLLHFRGRASCVDFWPDSAPGVDGMPRRIYRFRLRFAGTTTPAPTHPPSTSGSGAPSTRAGALRRARKFDRARAPSSYRTQGRRTPPEETAALQEKASQGHHQLLCELEETLEAAGWTHIEEIPAAVDLWARPSSQSSSRVIFEAKSAGSELHRVRAALAQLLEYRFLHGDPSDELCFVTNAPIRDERIRFLRALGIDVIWTSSVGSFVTRGECANRSVQALIDPRYPSAA